MIKFDYIFGYARKSPDDKENTDGSINNQVSLIRDKVKEWNGHLNEIFIDKNISGGDRNRKEFSELIARVQKLSEDSAFTFKICIVLKDQDRFARDSSYFKDTLKNLDVRGIKVFSILKGSFLDFTDIGDSVMSVVNEQMIIEGRKKAQILLRQKENNSLPSIPAPYGYRYYKKKWVADKRKADKVRGIVQRYVENAEFRAILKEFGIDKNTYYRIIKSAVKGLYSGLVVYDRKYKDSDGKIIRTDKISYPGKHEPLISEELWEKCQKK